MVRERYQRPRLHDEGTRWKLFYWDYTSTPRTRRSKSWAKDSVRSLRKAQRLADEFMDKVNARNNQPHLFASDDENVLNLYNQCRTLTWPHLKNSSRGDYEFFFSTYLNPTWGSTKLKKLTTMELQKYFNSFHPRLAPKTITLMHAALRAALSQAVAWGMLDRNPAIGVKLPRKKSRRPTVLLLLADIRRMIEVLPEPSRSIVILIVFASMRVGEVLALRWKRILPDRIQVVERVYDGEFDDVKTDAGEREVPFDDYGLIKSALHRMWTASKFRTPDDLIFANRKGRPLDRHNLLHRHIKAAARKLGLPAAINFRSFRTMHSSIMLRVGARPEVVRDNMGHAEIDVTQNVYGKSWWEERVDAVTSGVAAVFAAPARKKKPLEKLRGLPFKVSGAEWEPYWEPCSQQQMASA